MIILLKDQFGNLCKFADFTKDVKVTLQFEPSTKGEKLETKKISVTQDQDNGAYGHILLNFKRIGTYTLTVTVNGKVLCGCPYKMTFISDQTEKQRKEA
jgi:hypothetical protein